MLDVASVRLTAHDGLTEHRNCPTTFAAAHERARKDAPRALCRAGKAVADRPVAGGLRRGACRHRRSARAGEDARAAALALDLPARRARIRPDDQRVEGVARQPGAAFHAGAARGGGRAGVGRRHAQVAAAAALRASGRAAARGRVRLHPGGRSRHAVPVEPGRCTLNCSFCHTGTQRLVRNLMPGEIGGQIMVARDRLGEWPGAERARGDGLPTQGDRLVTNIVMMGMGEPLYNFEAVRDALAVAADGDGLSISKRRITLSTSGVVPMIPRAGAEIGSMLAVSLHAVRDDLRNELVPLNRKYPIAELMQACRDYPGLSNARRITFEYVMLKGVNDSLADAKALIRLLTGIPAKINLIPFNPWPGTRYECSDWEQ